MLLRNGYPGTDAAATLIAYPTRTGPTMTYWWPSKSPTIGRTCSSEPNYPGLNGNRYFTSATPALHTASSCEPVPPEQPIAPMILPSAIRGIPPREPTMSSSVIRYL
jgi:hypothetical protein